jgi:hypothetical protein
MFESLTAFLRSFSEGHPLFWALTIFVVIAATGLFLYGFWELVLRGVSAIAFRHKKTPND